MASLLCSVFSFVRVAVDRPKLYVNCGPTARLTTDATAGSPATNAVKFRCKSGGSTSICRWQPLDYEMFTDDIRVSIPIGYKDFNSIVVFVTLLVSWVSSYYAIAAICEKSTALQKRI